MQVAMLDWTQPLTGQATAMGSAPYVSQWACSNPLYLWPKLESGILRIASAEIAVGPFLQPSQ